LEVAADVLIIVVVSPIINVIIGVAAGTTVSTDHPLSRCSGGKNKECRQLEAHDDDWITGGKGRAMGRGIQKKGDWAKKMAW